MDGLFLNQKTNNNIRMSKKEYILYEKINGSAEWSKEDEQY